jgi:hypothetical protein
MCLVTLDLYEKKNYLNIILRASIIDFEKREINNLKIRRGNNMDSKLKIKIKYFNNFYGSL